MVEQNKLCHPAKQTRICKVIYISPDATQFVGHQIYQIRVFSWFFVFVRIAIQSRHVSNWRFIRSSKFEVHQTNLIFLPNYLMASVHLYQSLFSYFQTENVLLQALKNIFDQLFWFKLLLERLSQTLFCRAQSTLKVCNKPYFLMSSVFQYREKIYTAMRGPLINKPLQRITKPVTTRSFMTALSFSLRLHETKSTSSTR